MEGMQWKNKLSSGRGGMRKGVGEDGRVAAEEIKNEGGGVPRRDDEVDVKPRRNWR